MKQPLNAIKSQPQTEVNIYQELSLLPTEIADKITNAKTGGGRSLNAIHACKSLSQLEKHLLLVLGSQMNFCKEFANQYRYISLNDLAEKLSINQRTVSGLLNGVKRKTGYSPGLIEKGYVKKWVPTVQEQLKDHWKTNYCITPKIFDEYLVSCIEKEKAIIEKEKAIIEKEKAIIEKEKARLEKEGLSSDLRSDHPLIVDQMSSDLRSDKVPSNAPSYKFPQSLNAVAEQPVVPKTVLKEPEKRTRPPSKRKMKTWEDKSEAEKMETVLNQAFDAQRLGADRGAIRYFPFKDIPDLLLPIIKEHGLEEVKKFFDYLQKETIGCDIRSLGWAIENFKKMNL